MVDWKFNICPGSQQKIITQEQLEDRTILCMLKVLCAVLKTAPLSVNITIFFAFIGGVGNLHDVGTLCDIWYSERDSFCDCPDCRAGKLSFW